LTAPQAIYDGSSLSGANFCTITGTIGATQYVVQCCWNGSVAGVHIVNNNLQAVQSNAGTPGTAWIQAPAAFGGANTAAFAATGFAADHGANGGHQATAAEKAAANFYDAAATADIAMTDVFQASTPWNTAALNDDQVGVCDFLWVKGKGCATDACNWNRFKNITWQAANNLFAVGAIPLSMVTGNSADDNFTVVLTGRDPDSGTRLTAEVQALYSLALPIQNFEPQPISASLSLPSGTTALDGSAFGCTDGLWPTGSLYGIVYPDGNLGFASGGNLAAYMTVAVDCCAGDAFRTLPYIYATALGRNDAKAASADGSQWLSFDGAWYFADLANYPSNFNVVDPCNVVCAGMLAGTANTLQFDPITRGQYTMWSYEHMLTRTVGGLNTSQAVLKAAVLANFFADAVSGSGGDANLSGIHENTMKVKITKDGGVPATTLF
jgi:hypothetical protein